TEHDTTLAAIENERAESLQALTEADRKLRELSPYRAMRERYEQVSSMELIPAIRDLEPVPSRFQKACEDVETALLAIDGGGVAAERTRAEGLRDRFRTLLAAWDGAARRTEELAEQINQARSEYERGIADLEIAVLVRGDANGDGLATW